MKEKNYRSVGHSFRKKDSLQLLSGKPLYTEDKVPADALCVKLLRSPHANAVITGIDTAAAALVPGVVAVYTWKDVPANRFTIAGQTYPEPSPYDRLILDQHVRFCGDPVAIVAAENEKAALKALRRIRVTYEVLPAVTDMRKALDNPVLVHPEEDWSGRSYTGGDNKRNLVAAGCDACGDAEKVMNTCDMVIDRTYHTKAFSQTMMETFRTFSELDAYGRLHVISSTQIIFHCRRILSHALGIPKSMIRVEKPRIGGGFGAKQTAVSEIYPAFVTMKTGRPAYICYTREESQTAGSPRHEMLVHLRLGADLNGKIRAINMETLSNTGAYGEHGPTTIGLCGHKAIPLYGGNLEAYRFGFKVVYTNLQASGAYRGYGATQGIYAIESAVSELAEKLGMDPVAIRELNMVKEGVPMPGYHDKVTPSCALDRCMSRCKELFGWDEKYPVRDMGNGKVRAAGVAMAMQGSGIASIDTGSATIRLSDDGTYNLIIGAADMGTGCDTTLSQILSEEMDCDMEDIAVFGADTDVSPYDSGSYASSTAYLTGMAVSLACEELRKKICGLASEMMNCPQELLVFEGRQVVRTDTGEKLPLADIAAKSQSSSHTELSASASRSSDLSPSPFMVGMVEIEVDKNTGIVKVLDYTTVTDCGTPINPAIVRIQVEGGVVQGIGHTLTENVSHDRNGRMTGSSFLQYKIPVREEIPSLKTAFESSYETSGPFGAKSIGEIVINTPAPAITHAIARATGVWHHSLPITPEMIVFGKD